MSKGIKIIDTHCHLYSEILADDIENVILRANDAGIEKIFMPNIDETSIEAMLNLDEKYDNIFPMMGLHPCSVNAEYKKALDLIDNWFEKRAFVGVGETGIDLYWDKTYFKEQIIAFNYQIDIAINCNLPIIIHSRDSMELTIESISKKQNGSLTGIFHCFTGTLEQAKEIIDLGFYLGIGGVLTYKNSPLPDVVKEIDINHIVLETDSPYLPPVPMRGKSNEPSYLTYVFDKLVLAKEELPEIVAQITNKNANKIFKTS